MTKSGPLGLWCLYCRDRTTVSKVVNETAVEFIETGQASFGSDFGNDPRKEGILPHNPDLQF